MQTSMITDEPILQPNVMRRGDRHRLGFILVAAILLTAAALKAYQLATGPVIGVGVFASRWVLLSAVEYELLLGLMLVLGALPRLTWRLSVVTFVLFTVMTGYKALAGEASCGCFGRFQVDPRITLVIDLLVLTTLLILRPQADLRDQNMRRFMTALGLFLIAGLPAAIWMASAKFERLAAGSTLPAAGTLVVLEPEKWIGRPFPLIKSIESPVPLDRGEWLVVLFDRSCSHCTDAMPRFRQTAERLAAQASTTSVALIEITPQDQVGDPSLRLPANCALGRLKPTHDWFAQTPVEMLISDGIVKFAKDGGTGLDWFDPLTGQVKLAAAGLQGTGRSTRD